MAIRVPEGIPYQAQANVRDTVEGAELLLDADRGALSSNKPMLDRYGAQRPWPWRRPILDLFLELPPEESANIPTLDAREARAPTRGVRCTRKVGAHSARNLDCSSPYGVCFVAVNVLLESTFQGPTLVLWSPESFARTQVWMYVFTSVTPSDATPRSIEVWLAASSTLNALFPVSPVAVISGDDVKASVQSS